MQTITIAVIFASVFTFAAHADEMEERSSALSKLMNNGVTLELREAAHDYRCISSLFCNNLNVPDPEKIERAKVNLITQARNVPAPYKIGAFQCINDYEVCNGRQEKRPLSCYTTLIMCFADKLVDSYKSSGGGM